MLEHESLPLSYKLVAEVIGFVKVQVRIIVTDFGPIETTDSLWLNGSSSNIVLPGHDLCLSK